MPGALPTPRFFDVRKEDSTPRCRNRRVDAGHSHGFETSDLIVNMRSQCAPKSARISSIVEGNSPLSLYALEGPEWRGAWPRTSAATPRFKPSAYCAVGQVEAVLGDGIQYRRCDTALRQMLMRLQHHTSLEPPTDLRVQARREIMTGGVVRERE